MADYCTVTPATPGQTLGADEASTVTELYRAFTRQQQQDGGREMGRATFTEGIRRLPGVEEVRRWPTRAIALNVRAGTVHGDERGGEAGGSAPLLARAQIQRGVDQGPEDGVSRRPVEKGASSPASPAPPEIAAGCQRVLRCAFADDPPDYCTGWCRGADAVFPEDASWPPPRPS
ncbi:hypothetical protein ACFVYV_40285 [Streptomyces mirabilis]|uniref:hypothetical protein n=1 Tax=Streptomyces mirabilis TaxID=68239 RepID=UPI0036DDAE85